jgi:fucose 4-O-acetylase-like acetyltransferase
MAPSGAAKREKDMGGDVSRREHGVDLVRIGATYLLFLFHVNKVFDKGPFYHIKNSPPVIELDILSKFIHMWHMPTFFFLAGYSLYCALERRSSRIFLQERLKRIFLPFVAGTILFALPITFIEHVVIGPLDVGFLKYSALFFTSLKYFSWSHLWFLIYLFTFSILYLPLFQWARRAPSKRASAPLFLSVFFVILLSLQLALRERWPGHQNLYDDWANFTYYSGYLWLGFLVKKYLPISDWVKRHHLKLFAIGTLATATLLTIFITKGSTLYWQHYLVSTVTGFTFVLGLFGWARSLKIKDPKWIKKLSGSTLSIYILHQPAIVLLGALIIPSALPIAAKYGLLLLSSIALTIVFYKLIVRNLPPLAWLLGEKG